MTDLSGPVSAAGVVVGAYVIGAIPFANLFARATRGVDLRDVGTGTVSGTGLYRVAGMPALLVAGVLDVAKGAAGPLLAGGMDRPVLSTAAAGAAVAGHNWSVFLRFAGGRGLSPAMGALLVIAWQGAAFLLAALAVGRLLHETALVALIGILLLPGILVVTAGTQAVPAGVLIAVLLVAKRLLGNAPVRENHRRVYLSRLLFDSDQRRPRGAGAGG